MPEDRELCGAITAILIAHPTLVSSTASAYSMLDVPSEIATVRSVIMKWAQNEDGHLSGALKSAGISGDEIDRLAQSMPLEVKDIVLDPMHRDHAETIWWQIVATMRLDILSTELIIADEACSSGGDEKSKRRLNMLGSVMNYVVGIAAQESAGARPMTESEMSATPEELEELSKRSSELATAIMKTVTSYNPTEVLWVVVSAIGAATAQMALMSRDPMMFVEQVYRSSVNLVQFRQRDEALLREKSAGTVH
jgi:hypothetical protein